MYSLIGKDRQNVGPALISVATKSKISPLKSLYGQDPPLLLLSNINRLTEQRDAILPELTSNLLKAQDQMLTSITNGIPNLRLGFSLVAPL